MSRTEGMAGIIEVPAIQKRPDDQRAKAAA
ncbi:hypothetical protein ACVWZV_009269 [Bradyrhizobium sp. GM5.1]